MWGKIAIVAVLAGLVPAGALGQSATPVPIDQAGRFTLERTEKGILRLDRTTGAVSFCNERQDGWTCVPAADARQALDDEIARLQAENDEWRKRLAAAGANPDEPAKLPPEAVPPINPMPGDKEVDQFMDFAEKMMRRFFDMVDRLKRDYNDDRI
mgnify:FL=1